MANYPDFVLPLMNSAPGSIDRRFPKYWSDAEGGIDWNPPQGTPVVALADGVIVGAGYFCIGTHQYQLTSDSGACDHGVITTRVTNQDGSQTDLYYQHIILNSHIKPCWNGKASCGGQVVKKGQVIGWISNTNIEMGVNVGNSNGGPIAGGAHWGGIWGADPNPGPHIDPESYLRALISGQNATVSLSGTGVAISSPTGGSGFDILAPLTGLISQLSPLWTWLDNPARLMKLIAGAAFIILGLVMLVAPDTLKFIKNNPEVLAA